MRWMYTHIALLFGFFVAQAQEVRFPNIPDSLNTSEARSLYLAEHFWETNDMGDTLIMHHPTAVLDYIYILSKLQQNEAQRLMASTAERAVQYPSTYSYTEYWFEHFLHDSLSPYYDDELFIPFLERVICSGCEDIYKMRARFLLSRCMMNRVGQKATDFGFRDDDGRESLLSRVEADYILIWFYQKGCGACAEAADYLKSSENVSKAFSLHKIALVQIDVEKYPELPGEQYELQYFPVFYVLDKQHRVLVKEASLDKLAFFIDTLQ